MRVPGQDCLGCLKVYLTQFFAALNHIHEQQPPLEHEHDYAAADHSHNGGSAIVGEVRMWAGEVAPPSGWLYCDGDEISRSTYSDLFDVIGDAFGVGDGSTTFELPNLVGRFPIGVDFAYQLGAKGGEEEHTLTIAEMPSHRHTVFRRLYGEGGTARWTPVGNSYGNDTYTSYEGGNDAHNNLPPYQALLFIICAG